MRAELEARETQEKIPISGKWWGHGNTMGAAGPLSQNCKNYPGRFP